MLIWLAVPIPLLVAAVLYVFHSHRITWWELGIQLLVPVLLTLGAKSCVETAQTRATEYWGHSMTAAEYYEAWDEKVSCRHPISCSHPEYSTDSKGNRYQSGFQHFNDGYYHLYDVDDHPAEWRAILSNGNAIEITQTTYNRLVGQFGNNVWMNLNRKFHSYNGNKYVATWKGEWDRCEPVTVEHSYENRVQASRSVFNFAPVDPEVYGLKEHPKIVGYRQPAVLGGSVSGDGPKKLEYLNATMGASHQIRLFVIVFHGQPIQAALDQESFWRGGNKNEFTMCVGLNAAGEVDWCHVFSWTEAESFKQQARAVVLEQKSLDLLAYANWLEKEIPGNWRRKNFRDFDYLTVDPPMSAVVWTFIITLAVSGVMAAWAVFNQFETDRKPIMWSALLKSLIKKDGGP